MKYAWLAAGAGALLVGVGGALAATQTIDQMGLVFSVRHTEIKAGDTLTFANMDDVIHDIAITTPGGDEDDLGMQKPGEDLSYKFDQQGHYKVRCNIHPSMKLDVTVD